MFQVVYYIGSTRCFKIVDSQDEAEGTCKVMRRQGWRAHWEKV